MTKQWIISNKFHYSRLFSSEDEEVYTYRFPVYKYENFTILECELHITLGEDDIIIDVYDYGTIHEAPEFLLTLSEFGRDTVGINDEWAAASKPYVIKYRAKITEFEYYTFYEGQEDYLQDYHNGWIGLKKILFQKAVRSAFSELSSDVYAYMKPGRIIEPARIIECIPAEEWQDRISKYF